jgi:mRNA deadenylase 3'-5' endonuclease subunit Ccr4
VASVNNNDDDNNNKNMDIVDVVDVIHPSLGQYFRTTNMGEVSVTSFNMLAPFYHALALDYDTTITPPISEPPPPPTTITSIDMSNDNLTDNDTDTENSTHNDDDDDDDDDDRDTNEEDDAGSDENDDDEDDYYGSQRQDNDVVNTDSTSSSPNFSSSSSSSNSIDDDGQQRMKQQQQRREQFLFHDRTVRVPLAIQMAKRTNADILCLQEVEGGGYDDDIHRRRLEALLQVDEIVGVPLLMKDEINNEESYITTSTTTGSSTIDSTSRTATTTTTRTICGYDSFVWVPLMPNNNRGDIVGLCIAWRSHRHSLIHSEGYKRGMICQFQEVGSVVPSDKVTAAETTATATTTTTKMSSSLDDGGYNDDADSCAEQQEAGTTSLHNTLQKSPSTFCIANVHLPARPSNILGRLYTMSRTIRKLAELDGQHQRAGQRRHAGGSEPLDGLILVAGDFNSDQHSVTAQLLKRGTSNHGNLRDRNYKAKITKASAIQMKHPYRFRDVYDGRALLAQKYSSKTNNNHNSNENNGRTIVDLRRQYAPITVSLHGRGPGCMDQLFFATTANGSHIPTKSRRVFPPPFLDHSTPSSPTPTPVLITHHNSDAGKRQVRRKKGEARRHRMMSTPIEASMKANLQVESILATIRGPDDEERIRIIQDGLPNIEEGFPSDHLPIGALFVGHGRPSTLSYTFSSLISSTTQSADGMIRSNVGSNAPHRAPGNVLDTPRTTLDVPSTLESSVSSSVSSSSGVTASVQRRRQAQRTSASDRRRHNAVLKLVTDWLVGRGVQNVIRDTPLYKNPLILQTLDVQNLKRKSRAPDLVCLVNHKMMPFDDCDSDPTTLTTRNADDCDANSDTIIVLEVAVATNPERVRMEKVSKYEDLTTLSTLVSTTSCTYKGGEGTAKQCRLFTIIVDPNGTVPEQTKGSVNDLILLTSRARGLSRHDIENEVNRLSSRLQQVATKDAEFH